MHQVIFDVDGTLVDTYDFDSDCYAQAIRDVLGGEIDQDWGAYKHVTDSGILIEHIRNRGLLESAFEIQRAVKTQFINYIKQHLNTYPIQEIGGASIFLNELKGNKDVHLSIATGGWLESALLKLQSANIDISGVPIFSADDHYSRTEIMTQASFLSQRGSDTRFIYFGDGEWDREACIQLGFEFILVGSRFNHYPSIKDYSNCDAIKSLIDLD